MGRNVNIISDVHGKNIVVIHEICFKGKRKIAWDDVENYLKNFIGNAYEITDTHDLIHIGKDLHCLFIMKSEKLKDIILLV